MSMRARDRKIVLAIVPLLLIAGYFFLVLKPKRAEAVKAKQELVVQKQERDDALARVTELEGARATFASDYTTVVRLGKAVPTKVDMPSLLVQLEEAAQKARAEIGKIVVSERVPGAPAGAPATGGAAPAAGGGGQQPVAAGGAQAQTGPGKTVEKANDTASDAGDQAAEADGGDTTTSTPSKEGGLPIGGGAGGAAGAATGGSGAAGLDRVPMEMTFTGDFSDLVDFFHRLKRFVRVAEQRVNVRGRLLTIDGFSLKNEAFPTITAELKASIYLTPEAEGATAGAAPGGPAGAAAPAASPPPAGTTSSSPNATTPTATATP